MILPSTTALHATLSYAATHGLIMPIRDDNATPGTEIVHAPVTYSPSPFPAASFHIAKRITPALNTLMYRIASDHEFLHSRLMETAQADDFTGKLLQMMRDVDNNPIPKSMMIEFSILRYDYFVQHIDGEPQLRMVEMNTMAASSASLGTKVADLHKYVARHPATKLNIDPSQLPDTYAMEEIAHGIALAHNQYLKVHDLNPVPLGTLTSADSRANGIHNKNLPCVALIIAQPASTMFYDQDLHRIVLWEKHGVNMIRMSFGEVNKRAFIDDEGHLVLTPKDESERVIVTVVFFREGYSPDHFPTEREWDARLLIEKSLAVKCPSIPMQLVGLKKMQQIMAIPGVLEKFIDNEDDIALIRQTFVKQYSLSQYENGDEAVSMALSNPKDFVLKPQRESGGNNLYDEDIRKTLEECSPEERSAYILMEKIHSVVQKNVLIRHGVAKACDVISELGVFGMQVCVGGEEVDNWEGGTILRSKVATSNEGGIVAGFGYYDSPMLY